MTATSEHSAARRTSSSNSLSGWFLAARVGPLRGVGLWGSVLVILAFLAISIPQYGQPYVIDEAVFPYVAEGILKNGAPYFYNGETRSNDLGLWHPPLYDYLLAGQLLIWGVSPFAVRSFGAICVIAAFFVLSIALKRIAPELGQPAYVGMAALFFLNPLVISNALVPDIDGSLGVLLVALAIWVSTIVVGNPLSWRLVLIVFAFATLAVSTKYTLAGIVALMVGCAALISPLQRWWRVLWVVVAFAAGTAVSLGLLFGLGALLKFDARDPFNYLFGSLGSRAPGRTGLAGTLANLMVGPGSNLVWIGPAIILAALVALAAILVVKPRGVSRPLATLILGSGLAIIVGYSYISASPFSFPKYTSIAVPAFAVVAVLILTVRRPLGVTNQRPAVARWILGAAYVVILVLGTGGMYAISSRLERTRPRDLGVLFSLTIADFVCVLIATAALAWALGSAAEGRGIQRVRRPLAVGLVAALIFTPIMVQTSTSLVNLTSPFATRYYYRERGLAEFLTSAGEIIPPGSSLIAPKDVGLQLDRPFYEDAALLPLPPSQLRSQLEAIGAPYLVTRLLHDYSEPVFPEQFEVLREFYVPVLEGPDYDFTLWELK